MKHEQNNTRYNHSRNLKKIAKGIGAVAMSLTIVGGATMAVADKLSGGRTTDVILDEKVPLAGFAAEMVSQTTTERIKLEQNPEQARNINEIEPLCYEDENGRNIEFQFCSLDDNVSIDEEAFREQISRTCELADEKYGYEEFACQDDIPVQKVMYVFCGKKYVNSDIDWNHKVELNNGELEDAEQFRKFFTDEFSEDESHMGATMRIGNYNIDIVLIPTNPQSLTYHHTLPDNAFDSRTRYVASSKNELLTLVAGHEALHVVTDKQADDGVKTDADRVQLNENNLDSIMLNDKVVFYIDKNSKPNDESELIIDR